MLVNMSVWRDAESLNKYVYSSAHVEIMRRRKQWFNECPKRTRAVVGSQGSPPQRHRSDCETRSLRRRAQPHKHLLSATHFHRLTRCNRRPPSSFGDGCPAT